VILRNTLPAVQSFLSPAKLSACAAAFVCRFLLAFLCHSGRMSAACAARLPAADRRHRAAPGRFLGRQRWPRTGWLKALRCRLLAGQRRRDEGGTYFLLLDQTCFSRQGDSTPNTFCTGNRARRPRKGRRYTNKKYAPKRCHAFVFGLLLTPSGARLPYLLPYYTHQYAEAKGLPHRTQAELGAALIAEAARELPPSAKVVVLGDTAFEAAVVRAACAACGWGWITPCNPERVLEGPRPRPKVRSLLSGPLSLSAVKVHPDSDPYAAQRRWSDSARGRSTKGRTYWVCKRRCHVRSVGDVAVVLSTAVRPTKGQPMSEPKVLLASDAGLSGREVVRMYTLRWQVELFFKEVKGTLGLGGYRFREFERVERWAELASAAYLYLEWYRAREARREPAPEARGSWTGLRTAGLCAAVRAKRDEEELAWLAVRLATPAGRSRLRKAVRAALPPPAKAAAPAGRGLARAGAA
jgi:Transposase DDE domain